MAVNENNLQKPCAAAKRCAGDRMQQPEALNGILRARRGEN